MSSSSIISLSSFNLLFFTQVLTVLTSSIKYNEYVTDKGKNISIPCIADGNIMWIKENGNNNTIFQTGKYLVFTNVSAADRGLYVCFASVPPRNATEIALEIVNSTNADVAISIELQTNKSINSHSNNNIDTNVDLLNATIIANVTIQQTDVINAITTTNATIAVTTSTLPNYTITPTKPTTPTTPTKLTTTTKSAFLVSTTNRSSTDTISSSMSTLLEEEEQEEYQAIEKVNLTVRTTPGPVSQLYFKASTILGFLIWRFNKSASGGYPVRSFTAEFRNVSYVQTPYNSSFEHEWSRMDPINIAPNVRQMEVYRLEPNTTYEFRIWANNRLGSGEMVTTNVTTLPETKEEDLIRLIQPDLDNFDPRIWIVAVSVVLGTLVILAIGLCIVLTKECYQTTETVQDGWDSIELIPNIILNPGFCESTDGGPGAPFTRTIIFGDDDSDSYSEESDHEPRMEKFKRKVSVFFQGPTIKRI